MTRRDLAIGALLAAVVLAAHAGALHGTFHYDDQPAIVGNPAIRSWQPLFYWTSRLAVSGEVDTAGYRPLTVATFAANYALGRLDPFGYLVVNLALHLAVSWMVFLVGRRLLGDDRWALVAALVFALHPVNAEAVNYIVARSSLLATLGVLTAFWAFLRRWDGGSLWWPILGATAFGAALFSKESAVALVLPLAAYPWFRDAERPPAEARPCGRSRLIRNLTPILPWGVALLVYLAAWWSVAGSSMTPKSAAAAYPLWTFVELVGRSVWLWVWPWPLGLEYPLTFASRFDVPLAAVLTAAGVSAVVMGMALRRSAPLAAWAMLWVFAGFAPLAPLPWMTTKALFQENRLAFSAVGLAWLTAMTIRAVVSRLGVSGVRARFVQGAAAAIGALLAVGAIGMDRARSVVWNDDRRLWEEAVTRYPDNPLVHLNLGAVYYKNRTQFDLAEGEFRRALALSPKYPRVSYALGQLALRRERYDEARAWLLRTIALVPDYPGTYYALGEVERKQGRTEAAEAAFRRAVEFDPRDAKAHERLGLLAQQAGNDAAAETAYRAALQYDPDRAIARNNLGTIYLKRQDWPRALEQFTIAVRRDPTDVDVALNRVVALNALGRKDEARAAAEALLRDLPPDARFDAHRRAAETILGEGRS